MLRRRNIFLIILFIAIAAFMGTSFRQQQPSLAQTDETDACDALIDEALTLVANNCLRLGVNEICYGHDLISATLTDDSYFFEAPGDIVPVTAIDALFTRPANPDSGEWGVALMDVQADLADDTVRLILFGGVELVPDTTHVVEDVPTCTYTNTTDANINLRVGPGTDYSILDVFDRDDSVTVYGQTSDGAWLRSARGWFYSPEGTLDCAPGDELIVMNDPVDAYVNDMQSFTLRVDDEARCQAAPAGMLVQAPSGKTANLLINNVEVRVGSTAFITVDEQQECQTVANFDGTVDVTSQWVPLPKGGQVTVPIDEINNCGSMGVQPIDPSIAQLDDGLLNQLPEDIDVPEGWQPTPPTIDFSAADTEIELGTCTTLTWEVTDAVNVYLNGELVPASGEAEVCPVTPTTYVMEAEPLSDQVNGALARVNIGIIYPDDYDAPAFSLTITPDTISLGQCATLTWNAVGSVDAVSLDMGSGLVTVPFSGSESVCPAAPGIYIYTLQVLGLDGLTYNGSASLQVTGQPAEISFSATPADLYLGECTTLNWNVSNAVQATLDLGQGELSVDLIGSQQVCPVVVGELTYLLRATGTDGQLYTRPVSVTVREFGYTFAVDPVAIEVGDCAELSWDVTDANSVELDTGDGFQPVPVSGTQSVCPTDAGSYDYTLHIVSPLENEIFDTVTLEMLELDLQAAPTEIYMGESTTLTWDTTNAASVELDSGDGFVPVAASGSLDVIPPTSGNFTYTLRATSSNGLQFITSVDVMVLEGVQISFEIDPTEIYLGESAELSWTVTNALSVALDIGSGFQNVPASGSQIVTPASVGTFTYTLRATGALGDTYAQVATLDVFQSPDIIFDIAPEQVYLGDSAVLSWNVVDATLVELDTGGGFVEVAANDSQTVTPASTGTFSYSLRVTDALGDIFTQTVTLGVFPPPAVTFDVTPDQIYLGDAAVLSWNVVDATLVELDTGGGFVEVAASDSQTVTPASTGTFSYSLRVTGGLGDVSTQTVMLDVFDAPSIDTFEAMPPELYLGNTVELMWAVSNAVSVELDTGFGFAPVALSGNAYNAPSTTGTFTYNLRATGMLGDIITDTVSVTVYPEPTINFSASPETVYPENLSTLTWDVTDASLVELDTGGGFAPVAASGSTSVSPLEPGTYDYTLRATGLLGGTYTQTVTVTSYDYPYVIFDAMPTDFYLGDSTTLTWDVTDASEVKLDTGTGFVPVAPSDSVVVTPATTGAHTYTLRAYGLAGGFFDYTATVTVYPEPTINFSASPETVYPEDLSTLTWDVTDASLVELDDGRGFAPVAASGSTSVSPLEPGTYDYTLRATGLLGGIYEETVSVTAYPYPYIEFSAELTEIYLGDDTTLVWFTVEAASVELDTGSGFVLVADSGSTSVTPPGLGDHTYTLKVYGLAGGSFTRTVTVTVYPEPSITFTATPDVLYPEEMTTLEWSVTDAILVELDEGNGFIPVADSGSTSVSPPLFGDNIYTLRATGLIDGIFTQTVTVTVYDPPFLNYFYADQSYIYVGDSTELFWDTSSAMTVELDTGSGFAPVALSSSMVVTPPGAGNYAYTLRVYGYAGDYFDDTITVDVYEKAVIIDFTVTPTVLPLGDSVTLSWEVEFATLVELDTGSGPMSVAPIDSTIITPSSVGDHTYTLKAYGVLGDWVETSQTINVYLP